MDGRRIEEARRSVAQAAVVTPLLESEALNRRVDGRVLLKAESLQVTGSFKFRAAYHRMTRLTQVERMRGVVSYSSGNFGKALAAAGRRLHVSVRIVVPHDAPASKVEGIVEEGARVVSSDGRQENRETAAATAAERIARKSGAILLHPFEDEALIAAHAALVLEMLEQAHDRGASLDSIVVPCGGGGLAAGCCLALEEHRSTAEVIAVEPEGYDGMALSMAAGERRPCERTRSSICDALQAPTPGILAFDVARRRLNGTVAVSDAEVVEALRFAADRLSLVLEPSAAAPLAALLARRIPAAGKTLGMVLTGGNVEIGRLAAIVGVPPGLDLARRSLSVEGVPPLEGSHA